MRPYKRALPDASRSSLARGLCERLDWRSSSGVLAMASARKVLPRLAGRLGIELPPSRPGIPSGGAMAALSAPDGDVCCALKDLGTIRLVPVRDKVSRKRWEAMVATWHPLGWARAPGGQMRYWITSSRHGVLGVIGFCAESRHQKARDAWVGWSNDARAANIVEAAYAVLRERSWQGRRAENSSIRALETTRHAARALRAPWRTSWSRSAPRSGEDAHRSRSGTNTPRTAESAAAPGGPERRHRRLLEHRHEGGFTLAMAMLIGATSDDLFHLVDTGLADDRFAVERLCRARPR